MTADLPERLRDLAEYPPDTSTREAAYVTDLATKAADELDRLRAENGNLMYENKRLLVAWLTPVAWMSPDGLVGTFCPGQAGPVPKGYVPLAALPEGSR